MTNKPGPKSKVIPPTPQQTQRVGRSSPSLSIDEFVKRSQEEALSAAIQASQEKVARQRAIHEEFNQWKEALVNMITRGARLVLYRDGRYEFVLPTKLVTMVWQVTMRERIKMAIAEGGSPRDAITKLRDEFERATRDVLDARERAKRKTQAEAEEDNEKEG